MSEVLFYHLQNAPLEQVLPRLLEASLKRDWRVVVKVGSAEALEIVNDQLWSHSKDSFLPHGAPGDGAADQQPIYLTLDDENPNDAHVLFLVSGAAPGPIESFTRCVLMFDGQDEDALKAAREHWKTFKAAGHDASYWQQSEEGRWEKKV